MANTYSLDLEKASSQFASISDAAQTGLDITDKITIEVWAKHESFVNNDYHTCVIKGRDSYAHDSICNYALRVAVDGSGNATIQFYYNDGSGFHVFQQTTPSLVTGTYFHIAVTFTFGQGADIKLYVDVSPVTGTWVAGNGNAAVPANDNYFSIGAIHILDGAPAPDEEMDGLFDEVRVWNCIRTQDEIYYNYLRQLSGSEPNLVAYWRLNNNYLDETANNNDLTASNAPVFSVVVPFVNDIIYSKISGAVTLGVDPVENAKVTLLDSATDTVFDTVLTDVGGYYEFVSASLDPAKLYHCVVEYDDGVNYHNAESLPFLTPIEV
jgi:hypothetical protein